MGLADFHIHTTFSWDGMSTVSAVLKHVVDRTDLDVIAITDHNEITGALQALDLAPRYGVEVIPGCEISTADGHLLALYVQQKVPAGLKLVETIHRVGELGGLCIAAHPMARGTSSLSAEAIRQALELPGVAKVLVGIETFNAGLFHRGANVAALALAQTLPVAQVGSSDSHLLHTIGDAATEFYGKTAADLRVALEARETHVQIDHLAHGVTIMAGWLPRFLLRLFGWVAWNPDPESPIVLGRVSRARQSFQQA